MFAWRNFMLLAATCVAVAQPAIAQDEWVTDTADTEEQSSAWDDLDLSLTVGGEYRYFPKDPQDARQFEHHNVSGTLEPEAYFDWDNRDQALTLALFGRLDEHDQERSHVDVREAWYRYTTHDFEWRVGIRKVFWGVTESVHLVDIINQTDFVEDIDGEDKLGQPMINLAWFTGVGTVDFFVLPYFRERTFPGPEGRPRNLLPVDEDLARFESDDENSHIDIALRYANSFSGWDLGLSYLRGTAREPRIDFAFDQCTATVSAQDSNGQPLPDQSFACDQFAQQAPPPAGVTPGTTVVDLVNPVFVPIYDQINHFGLDLQYLSGGLFLKLEAIHQRSDFQDFTAVATGFEYSFYGVFTTDWDIGLISEYLYDSRGSIDEATARAAVDLADDGQLTFANPQQAAQAFGGALAAQSAAAFDNDIFAGTRITFNDTQSSEFLLGAALDPDTHAVFASLEASRRLGSSMKVSLTGRMFSQIPVTDPLFGLRDDDYLELLLEKFF